MFIIYLTGLVIFVLLLLPLSKIIMKQKLLSILFLGFTLFGFSQNTVIPDPNFEQALIDLSIDTNTTIDGQVPTANISSLTSLDVSSKNITDLTGIADFTALTSLICSINQLTSLDLSNNTALIFLNCYNNQITSLDVSNNTALSTLNCQDNQLTTLDVSNNTALASFYCYKNQLTSLDVTTNTDLTNLQCQDNQLTSLDVRNTNNTAFTYLLAYNNPNLTCILVDDADWSTTNWTNIDTTSTFVNNEAGCTALSLDDNTLELEVSVYPNPTNGKLFIKGNESPVAVSIYNVLGKEVISTKNTKNIDVKALPSGVYIIRISDGVRQTNRKFIKN